MEGASNRVVKDFRQLKLREELNGRKRKKELNSGASTNKRTRSGLQEKNSNKMLCNTEGSISSFRKIETRSQRQHQNILQEHNTSPELGKKSSFTFSNLFVPVAKSGTPLPELDWADPKEVWSVMLKKDRQCTRDHLYMRRHSHLQPRMRAILLDWLIEVCEVYRLHRDTYYRALDYVDRYLSEKTNIPKQRLQLIGTTALFIAAKLEEIYPPKLADFAYVTDAACTESEILDEELIMLKTLEWSLTPITPSAWLNIYLQLSETSKSRKKTTSSTFTLPQYRQQDYVQVIQLVDICSLDMGFLKFSYSILAASALYHMGRVDVEEITGHSWEELFPCIEWMRSFAAVTKEKGVATVKMFEQVQPEDAHNIQVHTTDLTILEKAQKQQHDFPPMPPNRTSPTVQATFIPLTPPSSSKKALQENIGPYV